MVMVIFALLANGCGSKRVAGDGTPTPLSSLTAVEVIPETEASLEGCYATPISDFPIRPPRNHIECPKNSAFVKKRKWRKKVMI